MTTGSRGDGWRRIAESSAEAGVGAEGDDLRVVALRTERRTDPIGIDEPRPRLSWRIDSDRPDTEQTGYRLQVATSPNFDGNVIWDTSDRVGAEQLVRYDGPPPPSRGRHFWRVSVRCRDERRSTWSEVASWEAGLLDPAAWTGRWIGYADPDAVTDPAALDAERPGALLRRAFEVATAVVSARLHVTALGLYEMSINGVRVGSQLLTPGWTDYQRRVQYQTYDLTSLLVEGRNVLGARVADGWFAGHVASFGRWQYGDAPLLLCQLEIETVGGRQRIETDENWTGRRGPATVAQLLHGERVDGRQESPGWDRPDGGPVDFMPVQLHADPGIAIVASRDEGVGVIRVLQGQAVRHLSGRRQIVDFGQNIAGHLRLEASGPAGATIMVRHGEALAPDGELYTDNLRAAEACDSYTFRGDGVERFEPRFTFHGFRFAEITAMTEGVRIDRLEAIAVSSARCTTGGFECSSELLNAVHGNAVWSLRDNFISIPTDCPQRDERLGWLADVEVFAPTALFLTDVANVLEAWLIDVSDGQRPSGAYPDFAPTLGWAGAGNSGWADAGILVPWTLYQHTGDRTPLERQYESMRRYLLFLAGDHTEGRRSAGRYGDWLSLGPATSKELVGTAYLAHVSRVFGRIAALLGSAEDARVAEGLENAARSAFIRDHVSEHGRIRDETQTGYAMALAFDLLPPDARQPAADRLATLVEEAHAHLATGFLGTPLILPVLSQTGHHELAARVAQQETYPSWGFEVRNGATTIWERWDSWTPEHGFNDPKMNSLNHYAFGAVADWMHRYVAGLAPTAPGYGRILVRPRPAAGITWARAHHDSPCGRHAVAWEVDAGTLVVKVDTPPNTVAEVALPGRAAEVLVTTQDGHESSAIRSIVERGLETVIELGSGSHRLRCSWPSGISS